MRGALLSLRLARRELRGGVRGFRLFFACLALGVGAIAAVGSMSAAIEAGLENDARALLGGDVEVQRPYLPATAVELAALEDGARLSAVVTMRSMARPEAGGAPSLVELKAVDGAYPLFGAARLEPEGVLAEALGHDGESWGAVAEVSLLSRLGLELGDRVRVGDATYRLSAIIAVEPDRATAGFGLGPRLMVSLESLPETGLVRQGSLIRYHYRAALEGQSPGDWVADIKARNPQAAWRIRQFSDSAPGLRNFIDRFTFFLTLIGLSALLVGGSGIATATAEYLGGKTATIATLKCLGAPARLVFWVYFWQMLALALLGIAAGIVLGAAVPPLIDGLVSDRLPVETRLGIYPAPLALAAAFGLCTAFAFALWPLGRACEVPAAGLFRDVVAARRRWPRPAYVAAVAATLLALAALAVAAAPDRLLAGWFVIGAALTYALFRGAAWGLKAAAKAAGRPRRPLIRLALANLTRPGATTDSVVISLGLGLTLLIAVGAVEANLTRQIEDRLTEDAPAFFFVDIQPDQVAEFDRIVGEVPGVGAVERLPSLRGRIVAINGVAAEEAVVDTGAAWALWSDRGLTHAAVLPAATRVVAGTWWPEDYAGPPLVSFDAHLAAEMYVGIGDTLTVNVLGREIVAMIANLREVSWGTLGLNFAVIFAPGALDGAPQTHIAAAQAAPEAEEPLLGAVTQRFANVTAIRVREALAAAGELLGGIALAVRATALVMLVAGLLVLSGAIAAGHRRRVYDSVILTVLGARRADVWRAHVIENALLGVATAAVAVVAGTVAGWAVVRGVMDADWVFAPGGAALTAALGVSATVLFGFLGTCRALGHPAAQVLRAR